MFAKRCIDKSFQQNLVYSDIEPDNTPDYFADGSKEEKYLYLKNKIAEVLTRQVGLVRNKNNLFAALERFDELEKEFTPVHNEYYTMRLKSLLLVSRLIVKSALSRKESRGGHIRDDYPARDEKLHDDTTMSLTEILEAEIH